MKIKTKELFFAYTSEFLNDYMPNQIGRSSNTIKTYCDSLTVLRYFVNDELNKSISVFEFQDCNYDCLVKFKKYLFQKGNSASTINNRIAAIKSYVQFVSDKDIKFQSYALEISHVKPCKGPKKVKEKLTDASVSEILKQPKNNKKGLRNRTIMVLLVSTAVRLNELLSLTLNDIIYRDNKAFIKVLGKGNKERLIILPNKCFDHLKQYLSIFHRDKPTKKDLLFYTVIHHKRNKIAENTVERFIQQYADSARAQCVEMPKRVFPHLFRAYTATAWYQESVPLEVVSRLLGHANLNTTLLYSDISDKVLEDAVNSIQPDIPLSKMKLWEGKEKELAKKFGIR